MVLNCCDFGGVQSCFGQTRVPGSESNSELIIVWGCTIQYIGDNYCRLWEPLLTNQKNAMTSRVVNIVNITIFLFVSHELSLFSMVFLSQSFSTPPFAKQ